MTLQQGIHYGITAEAYHSDPCEQPSLSSSGVKALLSGSPAEFAALHPRLTQWPDWAQKKGTRSQDLGSVAHSLVLGSNDCAYLVVDPEDLAAEGIVLKSGKRKGQPYKTWTGDAKVWKEAKEAEGFIIVSHEDDASIQSAVDSMRQLMISEYGDYPLGESEVTLIWTRPTSRGDITCRCRIDHLALRFVTLFDPKFTDLSLDDRTLQKKAAAEKWDIQQVFYLDGVRALCEAGIIDIADVSALQFRFPVAELNPPYDARFLDLPEDWMQDAMDDVEWASELFAKCLYSGKWPGYPRTCSPPQPDWRKYETQRRRESA